jgi:hypothetical protein
MKTKAPSSIKRFAAARRCPFVAAVDEGSFSAVRGDSIACSPQSAVGSEVWRQIGVMLFDRSGRLPEAHTRRRHPVGGRSHGCLGSGYAEGSRQAVSAGLEAELSVVIDVFFPTAVFSAAAKAFASQFPLTPRVRGRARSIRSNEHQGCTDRKARLANAYSSFLGGTVPVLLQTMPAEHSNVPEP